MTQPQPINFPSEKFKLMVGKYISSDGYKA